MCDKPEEEDGEDIVGQKVSAVEAVNIWEHFNCNPSTGRLARCSVLPPEVEKKANTISQNYYE